MNARKFTAGVEPVADGAYWITVTAAAIPGYLPPCPHRHRLSASEIRKMARRRHLTPDQVADEEARRLLALYRDLEARDVALRARAWSITDDPQPDAQKVTGL